MTPTKVLVLGLDPHTVAGYDPEPVVAAVERGRRRFEERGISCRLGLLPFDKLVPLDPSAEEQIIELLRLEPYECVVVGGGIRKEEDLLELFEIVINLVRRHAPQAAIAFNAAPDDGVDAAQRWIDTP